MTLIVQIHKIQSRKTLSSDSLAASTFLNVDKKKKNEKKKQNRLKMIGVCSSCGGLYFADFEQMNGYRVLLPFNMAWKCQPEVSLDMCVIFVVKNSKPQIKTAKNCKNYWCSYFLVSCYDIYYLVLNLMC